jgi:hypothetical protein
MLIVPQSFASFGLPTAAPAAAGGEAKAAVVNAGERVLTCRFDPCSLIPKSYNPLLHAAIIHHTLGGHFNDRSTALRLARWRV